MESAKVKLLQEDPQPFPPDMERGITRMESFEVSRVRKVLVPPDAALLTTLCCGASARVYLMYDKCRRQTSHGIKSTTLSSRRASPSRFCLTRLGALAPEGSLRSWGQAARGKVRKQPGQAATVVLGSWMLAGTLLNVLSGRISGAEGYVGASCVRRLRHQLLLAMFKPHCSLISLDDRPIDPVRFRSRIAYVMQERPQ